jgi:hypothetical protein
MDTSSTPVRHIIASKYKPGTTDEQIQQLIDGLRALQYQMPGIRSFEYGVNNSPEGLNQGFTHIFCFTFDDSQARDAYLPHPRHQEVIALAQRLDCVEDVFVIDYVPTP